MKSIGAVVAGIVVIVGVTTLIDALLRAVHVFPSSAQPLNDGLCALALSYRVGIGVFGAWLTARLAPSAPIAHAFVLGAIGTFAGIGGVAVTWNLNLGPHWYPIAIAALAFPQSWAGGALAAGARASMRSS